VSDQGLALCRQREQEERKVRESSSGCAAFAFAAHEQGCLPTHPPHTARGCWLQYDNEPIASGDRTDAPLSSHLDWFLITDSGLIACCPFIITLVRKRQGRPYKSGKVFLDSSAVRDEAIELPRSVIVNTK
jgi:hypothetical protein